MIDDSDGSPGPDTARPKGLPPWAWALIGLAVGALLIGGAWVLYESGRAAGERGSGSLAEATGTPDALVATVTSTVVTVTVPADPPASDPPHTDPPADPPANTPPANPPVLLGKPKIVPLVPIPDNPHPTSTLDYLLVGSYSKTGPWLSTAFGMASPGTIYMSIVVTKTSGGPITLKWIRIPPPTQSTTVLWSTQTSVVGQVGTSAEVAVTGGSYMIQVEAPVDAAYKMELWTHQ
jgi:hypothetical protein